MRAILDYGCGKLRYSNVLSTKCSSLTLVDSEVQLSRKQSLGCRKTSVRLYARSRWPHSRTLNVDAFWCDRRSYDFVLCANVLSAIPDQRCRSRVLSKLASVLSRRGKCLFVAQYRNSYFKEVASSQVTIPHLDGWIMKGRRGACYFGVLGKEKLVTLAVRNGFGIIRAWTNGESAYVLARRRKRKGPRASRQIDTNTHL